MEIAGFNWVDGATVLVVVLFLWQAWRVGVLPTLGSFFSFLVALITALHFYPAIGSMLEQATTLSAATAKAVGFLLTSVLVEIALNLSINIALSHFLKDRPLTRLEQWTALVPAFGQALTLIGFITLLLLTMPVAPMIKTDLSESRIGGWMIIRATGLEQSLRGVFGDVVEEALTYKIIRNDTEESVALDVETLNLSVDDAAEQEMVDLVNQERAKLGLSILVYDPTLRDVGRDHSTDMWQRKYFAHVSPDGDDVGDRLDDADRNFHLAGENLALAPTVSTAHLGLMNSPGHRENILRPEFNRIGIGVVTNGYYGKMFTQVFTD